MKENYFTRNFWLMIGTFLIIVLITMIGLAFLMQRDDFVAKVNYRSISQTL